MAGYDVRLLVRDPKGRTNEDVRGFDLAAAAAAERNILADVDAVVHLAARIPTNHADPAEARRCMAVNAFGTLGLIEAMQEAGVGRLVQTTTANAYAPWITYPDERAPLFPETRVYYFGSKIAQEFLAQDACFKAQMHLTTLRLGSVYGVGQPAGAIPSMVRSLLAGQTVTLVDGGRFGADFVNADDVIRAVLLCLKSTIAGPINVGSGVRQTIREIADILLRLTGHDEDKVAVSDTQDDPDLGFPALNIGRLLELGWQPTGLENGLAEMVRSVLKSERRRSPPLPAIST
jgi:UDP-glucose 4-epimerase